MNPLVITIQQQLLAEAKAAVAQVAEGGEVILRGVTIRRHPDGGPWFVEIPLPKTGKHETVDRRQFDERGMPGDAQRTVAEAVAYAIERRLRTEHKTPEAVYAAFQTAVPLVRVYRSMDAPWTKISIFADPAPGTLVYEIVGQSSTTDADFWHGSEADLLAVLLDPMGLTVRNGWIVANPVQEQPR